MIRSLRMGFLLTSSQASCARPGRSPSARSAFHSARHLHARGPDGWLRSALLPPAVCRALACAAGKCLGVREGSGPTPECTLNLVRTPPSSRLVPRPYHQSHVACTPCSPRASLLSTTFGTRTKVARVARRRVLFRLGRRRGRVGTVDGETISERGDPLSPGSVGLAHPPLSSGGPGHGILLRSVSASTRHPLVLTTRCRDFSACPRPGATAQHRAGTRDATISALYVRPDRNPSRRGPSVAAGPAPGRRRSIGGSPLSVHIGLWPNWGPCGRCGSRIASGRRIFTRRHGKASRAAWTLSVAGLTSRRGRPPGNCSLIVRFVPYRSFARSPFSFAFAPASSRVRLRVPRSRHHQGSHGTSAPMTAKRQLAHVGVTTTRNASFRRAHPSDGQLANSQFCAQIRANWRKLGRSGKLGPF